MKRLTYFQVHKNKKAKKPTFYISKKTIENCIKEMERKYNLFLLMQEAKGDF